MFNPLALVSSIMHTISCKILNETGNNATRYNPEMPVLEYRAACYPYPDIQSKFDNSKRKGPQKIFRMIESSNFRESPKKSDMFGHFHSDNGMARLDSFISAFPRIYGNLCTRNEENVFIRVLS